MRQTHLTRPQDVRRLLSKIVNQVINSELDVNKANCVGQLCNVLLRAMEKSDLEQRIEELERLVNSRSNKITSEDIFK